MDLSAILAHPFLLLVPAFMLFVLLLRVLNRSSHGQVSVRGVEKSSDPKRKNRLRFAAAFIGNPLMPLHAIVHPQVRYVIAEQLKDHSEDQDTDPFDPTQYLQSQLKRIRAGERLDRITTRLR